LAKHELSKLETREENVRDGIPKVTCIFATRAKENETGPQEDLLHATTETIIYLGIIITTTTLGLSFLFSYKHGVVSLCLFH
jgi:hypothetical protein